VASGLSPLAPGFGAVWTADPIGGEILRIDPATRRVTARIAVDGEAFVAAGAGAVWAIAGDLQFTDGGPVRLLRIDPATNQVVARIPVRSQAGDRIGPVDLQIEDGAVWVVGVSGALRIDPARNAVAGYVDLTDEAGDDARGTVVDGDSVWALTVDGRLRRFDAATGSVVDELAVRARPDSFLSWGPPGTLTLIGTGELALIERATGRPLWQTRLTGDIRYWTADGDVLWVGHVARTPAERDRLTRLDAETGRRLGHVDLPEPGVAGIAKVGDEVWVATPGGKVVVVR
jgi:outer membrane protein assembly factor BamB